MYLIMFCCGTLKCQDICPHSTHRLTNQLFMLSTSPGKRSKNKNITKVKVGCCVNASVNVVYVTVKNLSSVVVIECGVVKR